MRAASDVTPRRAVARDRWLRSAHRLVFIAACVLAAVLLAACDSDELLTRATPVPGAAATAARAAATPIPTRPAPPAAATQVLSTRSRAPTAPQVAQTPRAEEAEPAEVVAAIARALETQDTSRLEAVMLTRLALATQGSGGEMVRREDARTWLAERLGSGIKVQEWRLVEDFGLVEVITGPWPQRPPLTNGTITFNLHRYNSNGQQDASRGDWRIDVIIAE